MAIGALHNPEVIPHSFVDADFIQVAERPHNLPVGIRFLGSLTLFEPDSHLSAREQECTALAILGEASATISEDLYLSESTVKGHLRRSFKKTGAATRSNLLESCLDTEVMVLARGITTDHVQHLTDREKNVAAGVALGRTNADIGRTLGLSELTIKAKLVIMSQKLGYGQRELIGATATLSGITGVSVNERQGRLLYEYYQDLRRVSGKPFLIKPVRLESREAASA